MTKLEEQKARNDYAFAQSIQHHWNRQMAYQPRESPLLDYIKAIKQVIIKIAVQKLAQLTEKADVDEESKE